MMNGLTALVFVMMILIAVFIYIQNKAFNKEREAWQAERKDLYNRIQASSYTEYKALEEKPKEKKDEEKPIEWV